MVSNRNPGRPKGSGGGLPRHSCIPMEQKREEFLAKIDRNAPNGCWVWLGVKDSSGYGKFCFERKVVLAHRFSWLVHNGAWPTQPYVCHRCDNPSCVNPSHLFEGDATDNNRDMMRKGRDVHWGCPKLKPEQVIEIRRLYKTGRFSYRSLGEHLGLPQTQIFSALNKWKTLPKYGHTQV